MSAASREYLQYQAEQQAREEQQAAYYSGSQKQVEFAMNRDQMQASHAALGMLIDLAMDALLEMAGRGRELMYDNLQAAINNSGYKSAWKRDRLAELDAAMQKTEPAGMIDRILKDIDALPFSDVRVEKDEQNKCVIRTIGNFIPTNVNSDL